MNVGVYSTGKGNKNMMNGKGNARTARTVNTHTQYEININTVAVLVKNIPADHSRSRHVNTIHPKKIWTEDPAACKVPLKTLALSTQKWSCYKTIFY